MSARSTLASRSLLGVLLLAPVILVGGLAPTRAAPVPTHLMKHRFSHPTTVGTKWVYTLVSGSEKAVILTEVEDKDGAKIVTLKEILADQSLIPYQKLRVGDREWAYISTGRGRYFTPWVFLKLPLTQEYRWKTRPSRPSQPNPNEWVSVQAAGARTLQTPAGEYEAAQVMCGESTGDEDPVGERFWFASGVGLVKIDNPYYMVLKSFTPGKE